VLPLCHATSGLDVKVFGTSQWPVANYLGALDAPDERDLYASARVCLNVSEPHSTDLGWDVIERPFKVLAAGGACVSDYVEEAADLFAPTELAMERTTGAFAERVRYLVRHPEAAAQLAAAGRKKVLARHTYFDRAADLLAYLGLSAEAERVMAAKDRFVPKE
jgi:spore maturation protein CgeB